MCRCKTTSFMFKLSHMNVVGYKAIASFPQLYLIGTLYCKWIVLDKYESFEAISISTSWVPKFILLILAHRTKLLVTTGIKLISMYYTGILQLSDHSTQCPVLMIKDTATPLMFSFEVRLMLICVYGSLKQSYFIGISWNVTWSKYREELISMIIIWPNLWRCVLLRIKSELSIWYELQKTWT